MTVQVVRPSGAGHETLYVLLFCLLVLTLAGSVVAWQAQDDSTGSLPAHQLDTRRDLGAAEQGIYADLRVALEEAQLRHAEDGAWLGVEDFAEEGFPPFAEDASSRSRGAHVWQRLDGAHPAYLGLTGAADVAGSFLLRLQDGEADIWLNRNADAGVPADRTVDALIAAGWRQLIAQFDSGVTRQHRH